MICEVVAVGTELLLGPNVDTNSTWIGERLAEAGIDSYFHTVVGDNHVRIVETLKTALTRSDAVIVTGGLGPTQDDITRNAIAEVMGVELRMDQVALDRIKKHFADRGRTMAPSNEQQALVPIGGSALEQSLGTAPGLLCPIGDKVIYAVPGVPREMEELVKLQVIPDLQNRAGVNYSIQSRYLRTWGTPESTLADMLAAHVEELDAPRSDGNSVTLAYLASGVEGIKIRITARASDAASANVLLAHEEAKLRELLGDLIFGIDGETMEAAIGRLMLEKHLSLAVAESLTGGLVAKRLTDVSGASEWFKGGVVSYANEVKYNVLDVTPGPVVTAQAAIEMAEGVRKLLGASVGLGFTGVAGPTLQEGHPVGTVFGAIALENESESEAFSFNFGATDRQRIRDFACINLLNELRKKLL